MFNFCSLYSGSSGNSLFIQTENTKILIDAGESCKKIVEGLSNINININELDAILITHEHIDHTKGLGTLSKKFDIPVYANSKTWDNMPMQKDKISDKNIKKFNTSEKFEIGDLTINSFNIPHDAADPCGFNILKDNKKISIATDIGHMTNNILKILENSYFLLLEANYDPNILKCSKYPYTLKQRIAGPNGHLSNEIAGETISILINSGLRNVMLGHLSKENNFPELAYKTVVEKLMQNNINQSLISLNIAKRDTPSNLINII